MALQLFVLLKILQMVFSYSIGEYTHDCADNNGIMLDGQCFIFSEPDDERSWQNATEHCYEKYGPLATPANPTNLYDYTNTAYQNISFWVGGYSPPHEEHFIWINGTQIPKEFPWGHEEPLNRTKVSDQRCVEVNYNGGYASQPCSDEQRYICILDACGAMGGVTLGYQCLLFKDDHIPWNNATEACPPRGKLAMPAYPDLLMQYADKHYEGKRFWLGGLKVEFSHSGNISSSWYWLNGRPIPYDRIHSWTSGEQEDQQVITSDYQDNRQVISECLDLQSLAFSLNNNCIQPRGLICEMDTSMTQSPTFVQFLIRQISSGEYVGPDTVFPKNKDEVILHYISDPNMHMTFDIVDGKWGYIRHVMSGKILSPMVNGTYAAPMNPPDGSNVVLQSDRRPWALFALDQYHNRIIHRSGKFISSDGNNVTITGDESKKNTMGFQFMNIAIHDKEVLPYGSPDISGDWQLVFSDLKPKSSFTYSEKVTIGKSVSLSTSQDFKFGFEVATNERSSTLTSSCSSWLWGITTCTDSSSNSDISTAHSVSDEMDQASSDTWNSESEHDISITVEAGRSVAVWQRIFILEHKGHKTVHLSNMFADTDSPMIKPDNFGTPRRHSL